MTLMKGFRRVSRPVSLLLLFVLVNQTFLPTVALALTSGPSQPEVSTFTPAGTGDMVDLFSGDFQYNIPLLDVGGYPINIAYTAGVGMDEEASWVGLGWNLNPGAINRQMRGVPDDFKGDSIVKAFNIRPDITTGITVGAGSELVGLPFLNLEASRGVYYNSYRGYGQNINISPTLSIGKANGGLFTANMGLNIGYDTQDGLDLNASLGLNLRTRDFVNKLKLSTGMNSQRGLRDLSASFHRDKETQKSYTYKDKEGKDQTGTYKRKEEAKIFGGRVSFFGPTYLPTADLPLKNKSFTLRRTLGGEVIALHGYIFDEGYRSEQSLAFNRQAQSAFGYLHSQSAKASDVMDFNRERHGLPWREDMPLLPLGFGTNDLFSASGQGASGQYRAMRNDIGFFSDAFHANQNQSFSLGVEVGAFPNMARLGGNLGVTSVTTKAKGWKEGNALAGVTKHTDWDSISVYEPVFFKNSGEMTPTDEEFLDKIGGGMPTLADLETRTGDVKTAFLISSNQKFTGKRAFSSTPVLRRSARERRNDVFQYLTGAEASIHGLEKSVRSYKRNKPRLSKDVADCAVDMVLSRRRYKGHHISEVTVLKPDGARYVYGIPAYNTLQKDVAFSIGNMNDGGTGLVQYTGDAAMGTGDNSLNNNTDTRDRFYSSESTPPYPYAFLLTGVLSPDYVDRTGNGITGDDHGTAVRINYTRNERLFKWRTPYGTDSTTVLRAARHQPGRKSDTRDNKASYIYGEKEVWYVHSIESATMVAQFYTSRRLDGLGAAGEDGGIDTDTLAAPQKLDKIALYSKADLQAHGNAAVPLKTVHFSYDYELCPGVPNSNNPGGRGKLTLRKVWFTYGNSGRGVLNAYTFAYKNGPDADASHRFFYNMTNVDRWGNYKVNPTGYPGTSDYPYSLQDTTDNISNNASIYDYAGAWSLSSITLPSGGTINVEYEPDDYAYVQDKRAGQMFFVKGFSKPSAPTTIDSTLFSGSGESDVNRYVWVDVSALKLAANTIPDTHAFKARCLEGIDNIWFHMDVRMTSNAGVREDITGYMEYDKSLPLQSLAVADGNLPAVGIPVRIAETDNNNPIHPVSKAALQTMRLELPALAYPGSEGSSSPFLVEITKLVGLVATIKNIFKGFESNKMASGSAEYVGVTQNAGLKTSWIRLCNPRFKKFGGGHRVKSVTLDDNWGSMASGKPSAVYGQTYTYTTKQQVVVGDEEQTFTISSGVASWEPALGGEENLWKEPVTYNQSIKLAPDNSYYVEKPFGESLFPGPMVGYSEVRVQNIAHAKNPRSGSGWTVNKYYTAKDFPTRVDYSAPHKHRDKSPFLRRLFRIVAKDYLSMSQGFVVEVNDMHGKMKQEAAYAQNGALISSATYEYKVDDDKAEAFHLNNRVRVVKPNGNLEDERLLGVDVEMWQDFREESTLTEGTGFASNTDASWFAIFALIIFMGQLFYNKEDLRFRSAVTTKYIKRSGILEKVTKVQDGSSITTENLLWDSETGAVLATKTQNEFEDPIYQFTYPAHWAYEGGMGMAYKSAGTHLAKVYFVNGRPFLDQAGTTPLPGFDDQPFADGDEFGVVRSPQRWKFPIASANRLTLYKVPGGSRRFYTDAGVPFSASGAFDLYMVRSGRRNMALAPVGSIVSKKSPLDGYSTIQAFAADAGNNRVVDASGTTFSDLWQRDCNCQPDVAGDTLNPYRHGIKGNWRLGDTYVNHRKRTASKMLTAVGSTNIRTDGVNEGFSPFWDYVSGSWVPDLSGSDGWVRQSTATLYDSKGNQNEELDALGIHSTAQYGYQGNLNTAVAHNSRFRQSLFEGFEDYNYNVTPGCDSIPDCAFFDHGRFDRNFIEGGSAMASDSFAHTGKYSYRVRNHSNFGLEVPLDSSTGTSVLAVDGNFYRSGGAACRRTFNPTPGTYLLSAWLKVPAACDTVEAGPYIEVTQGGTAPQQLFPDGPVVDGWQRIYGKVEVSAVTGNLRIKLVNTGTPEAAYFDDIRFHPWLANMKSFVYDPHSQRLMATLDENNYATFYEYDDEGMLVRVKRETERGVMTIQEHRSSLKH